MFGGGGVMVIGFLGVWCSLVGGFLLLACS